MKYAVLTLLLSFLFFSPSIAQHDTAHIVHVDVETNDYHWESLTEENHAYKQKQQEEEEMELAKFRHLIRQSIHNELQEVEHLSKDVIKNFAVIEDHFHQEFEALGLSYIKYEHFESNSPMPKQNWVDHHTNKIIEHKLAKVEKELDEFYD